MPDITMCCNYNCPMKKKCYRYRAVPEEMWQSFALFKPSVLDDGRTECDYYWEVDEAKDRTLSTEVVDNRYERDGKWKGLLEDNDAEK